MNLRNLLAIQRLQAHTADPEAVRKLRNVNDYVGDPIPALALATCIEGAEALLELTGLWLREHRPELLG